MGCFVPFETQTSAPQAFQLVGPLQDRLRPSSLNEAYYQHNDRDDEQNMDKPTHCITTEESQQPENKKYQTDSPKHNALLLVFSYMTAHTANKHTNYPLHGPMKCNFEIHS